MQIIRDQPVKGLPDFASLLQPALHHQSPADVLNDADLEAHEKRAILSSWASDLYAVESCPWLRQIPGVKATLRLSDVLAALRTLDEDDDPPPRGGMAMRIAGTRRSRVPAPRWGLWTSGGRMRRQWRPATGERGKPAPSGPTKGAWHARPEEPARKAAG